LLLSGPKLYKETADGMLYPLRQGGGQWVADSDGAIYGLASPVGRLSPNCGPASLVSQTTMGFPQGLAIDSVGAIYVAGDNSVWRIAPVTPPIVDTPAIYLDNPGGFNAASNLTATIPPTQPCFHGCYPITVNDAIAAYEIIHITGGCMGPLEPAQASFDGGRLPTILQQTRVLFDGVAAPLISVQATEIIAIAPHDIASKSKVTVAVENQGVKASAVLNVAAAVPGTFVLSGKQAAAINQDGSINGTDHPAAVGSIVALYLTGTGLTNPQIEDGVAPALPLPPVALPVTVQIGAASAEVLYAGSTFGFAGLTQVNVRIPPVAASDAVPVKVSVGGNARDQAVTIAVR
jgi:uncharacterized protein (TIGR03437 family)